MNTPELTALVTRGMRLSRVDAERIVALGVEAAPALLEALGSDDAGQKMAAARLLGAIGDTRALAPLADILEHQDDDDFLDADREGDVYGHALSSFGEAALPHLVRVCERQAADRTRSDISAVFALGDLGMHLPDLRPRVAEVLMRLLDSPNEGVREIAIEELLELDWRPAAEQLVAASTDKYLGRMVADWAASSPRTFVPWRPPDLLEGFLSPHRAAMEAAREALRGPMLAAPFEPHEFGEDLGRVAHAASASLAARHAPVGRNDACPCGSGRKYKKCCMARDEAASRPHPALARLAQVAWDGAGYAMLPSAQLRDLPPEAVADHLGILTSSAPEVRARAARESDDYALWACAERLRQLRQGASSRELALLIAASGQAHPALHYPTIELYALTAIDHTSTAAFLDSAMRTALRTADLALAWTVAEDASTQETMLEAWLRIWDAFPEVLWTPAAMAEAMEFMPEMVIPHVRRAHEQALAGRSAPPPHPRHRALGEAVGACPAEVLEGYLADLESRADIWRRVANLRQEHRQALLPEHEQRVGRLLSQATTLERWVSTDEEHAARRAAFADELTREAVEVAQAVLGAERRDVVPVLLSQRDEGILCLCPVPWSEAAASALAWRVHGAVSVAAHERADDATVSSVDWHGWAAVVGEAPGTSPDDLVDLVRITLEEAGEAPPLVGIPYPGGLPLQASAEALPAVSRPIHPFEEQSEPDEADLGLADYLRRVLVRLVRMGKIGAAHTQMEHFFRGVPKRVRGDLKDVFDRLVVEGYVRVKPTTKEPHISLEPRPLPDVLDFIEGAPWPSEEVRRLLG